MTSLINIIKEKSKQQWPDMVAIRRHIHAHPELSFQEKNTSLFIRNTLQQWGISSTVIGETGVVGCIEGKNPSQRTIALRADIDALPIQEENKVPYISTCKGVMHACGHDVHTTCLLGAVKILHETKDQWAGTIKFIFQPGEEKNPGGAKILIEQGVLKNPAPTSIFGLHVHPGLPIGEMSFKEGKIMASADEIYVTIRGKGGHAGVPHLTVDPIIMASQWVVSLQQIISRRKPPLIPSVLSICAMNGGNTHNVIPSEVKLIGTFRSLDEEWRYQAHEIIRKQSIDLIHAMGGEIDLHIDIGYPSVFSHPTPTNMAKALAETYMGASQIKETEIRLGAEDFGYYTQQIPGCFFRLGVQNTEKGIIHSVHTPLFDIDEKAIEYGVGIMAWIGSQAEK